MTYVDSTAWVMAALRSKATFAPQVTRADGVLSRSVRWLYAFNTQRRGADRHCKACRVYRVFMALSLSQFLPHTSLRQLLSPPVPTNGAGAAKQWRPCTPAMAAGLTEHVWTLREVMRCGVPPWPQPQARHGVGKKMIMKRSRGHARAQAWRAGRGSEKPEEASDDRRLHPAQMDWGAARSMIRRMQVHNHELVFDAQGREPPRLRGGGMMQAVLPEFVTAPPPLHALLLQVLETQVATPQGIDRPRFTARSRSGRRPLRPPAGGRRPRWLAARGRRPRGRR